MAKAQWQQIVQDTAAKYPQIPAGLLDSVAQQESAYNPDIVTGTRNSSAGAQGLMQWMPKSAEEYGVNPLDPASSADGTARYLLALKKQFGSWNGALTAYNWGPGNLAKYRAGKLKSMPTEAENYASSVMSRLAPGAAVVAPVEAPASMSPVPVPAAAPLANNPAIASTAMSPVPAMATPVWQTAPGMQQSTPVPAPDMGTPAPPVPAPDMAPMRKVKDVGATAVFPIDTGDNLYGVVAKNAKERALLGSLAPTEQGLATTLPTLMSLVSTLEQPKQLMRQQPVGADAVDELLLSIVRKL